MGGHAHGGDRRWPVDAAAVAMAALYYGLAYY